MAVNPKKGGMKTGAVMGVLAAAAVASAAGYYFYASPNAKQHRKIAAKWSAGLKKEVLKRAKQVKKMDSKAMAIIVDEAAAAYHKVRSIDKADIAKASAELKKNWKHIVQELEPTKKAVTKAAKKTVRSAKKTVRKMTA